MHREDLVKGKEAQWDVQRDKPHTQTHTHIKATRQIVLFQVQWVTIDTP